MKKTQETLEIIINTINDGNTRLEACRRAGVDYSTLYRWIQSDGNLCNALKKAEIEGSQKAKETCFAAVLKAAESGTWQAACWILERRWPAEYGRYQRLDFNSEPPKLHITKEEYLEAKRHIDELLKEYEDDGEKP